MKNKVPTMPTFAGVLLFVLGFFLLIAPGASLSILMSCVGIGLILVGGINFLCYCFSRSTIRFPGWILIQSLVDVAFGLLIFFRLSLITTLAAVIIGLWALATGGIQFAFAVENRHGGAYSGWKSHAVTSLLRMVFGVLCLISPAWSVRAITFVIGLSLLACGAFSVWSSLNLRKSM